MGTLLQEQDNERQLPIVLTAGDFSLYEDCVPYFDSFTKKNFYLGNTLCTRLLFVYCGNAITLLQHYLALSWHLTWTKTKINVYVKYLHKFWYLNRLLLGEQKCESTGGNVNMKALSNI